MVPNILSATSRIKKEFKATINKAYIMKNFWFFSLYKARRYININIETGIKSA